MLFIWLHQILVVAYRIQFLDQGALPHLFLGICFKVGTEAGVKVEGWRNINDLILWWEGAFLALSLSLGSMLRTLKIIHSFSQEDEKPVRLPQSWSSVHCKDGHSHSFAKLFFFAPTVHRRWNSGLNFSCQKCHLKCFLKK